MYSVLVWDVGLPAGKDFLVELVAPPFPERPLFGTANHCRDWLSWCSPIQWPCHSPLVRVEWIWRSRWSRDGMYRRVVVWERKGWLGGRDKAFVALPHREYFSLWSRKVVGGWSSRSERYWRDAAISNGGSTASPYGWRHSRHHGSTVNCSRSTKRGTGRMQIAQGQVRTMYLMSQLVSLTASMWKYVRQLIQKILSGGSEAACTIRNKWSYTEKKEGNGKVL